MKSVQYSAKLWRFEGKGGWYFATVPRAVSIRIRKSFGGHEEGWGRLRVKASMSKSAKPGKRNSSATWSTAIWYDTRLAAYLLPINALVRRTTKVEIGDRVSCILEIETDNRIRIQPNHRKGVQARRASLRSRPNRG